jgi:stage IV sporulation protein FB
LIKRMVPVPVRIHPLFWLIVCSAVWTGYFIEIITLFVLVLIHELGHAAAAGAFGWRVDSIELLPFGGVVKTDEWGTVPSREEMTVALAGPFQHILMILISLFFFRQGWWTKEWTEYFIQGNLMIAGFNLLPVYPLDGGRVFLSALSYFFPYRFCLHFTLWTGMAGSLALCVLALFWSPGGILVHLLILGIFLFYSNLRMFRQKNIHFVRFLLFRRHHPDLSRPVKKLRMKPDTRLNEVILKLCKEKYHVLEIVDQNGELVSILPEEWLLDAYMSCPYGKTTIKEWFAS